MNKLLDKINASETAIKNAKVSTQDQKNEISNLLSQLAANKQILIDTGTSTMEKIAELTKSNITTLQDMNNEKLKIIEAAKTVPAQIINNIKSTNEMAYDVAAIKADPGMAKAMAKYISKTEEKNGILASKKEINGITAFQAMIEYKKNNPMASTLLPKLMDVPIGWEKEQTYVITGENKNTIKYDEPTQMKGSTPTPETQPKPFNDGDLYRIDSYSGKDVETTEGLKLGEYIGTDGKIKSGRVTALVRGDILNSIQGIDPSKWKNMEDTVVGEDTHVITGKDAKTGLLLVHEIPLQRIGGGNIAPRTTQTPAGQQIEYEPSGQGDTALLAYAIATGQMTPQQATEYAQQQGTLKMLKDREAAEPKRTTIDVKTNLVKTNVAHEGGSATMDKITTAIGNAWNIGYAGTDAKLHEQGLTTKTGIQNTGTFVAGNSVIEDMKAEAIMLNPLISDSERKTQLLELGRTQMLDERTDVTTDGKQRINDIIKTGLSTYNLQDTELVGMYATKDQLNKLDKTKLAELWYSGYDQEMTNKGFKLADITKGLTGDELNMAQTTGQNTGVARFAATALKPNYSGIVLLDIPLGIVLGDFADLGKVAKAVVKAPISIGKVGLKAGSELIGEGGKILNYADQLASANFIPSTQFTSILSIQPVGSLGHVEDALAKKYSMFEVTKNADVIPIRSSELPSITKIESKTFTGNTNIQDAVDVMNDMNNAAKLNPTGAAAQLGAIRLGDFKSVEDLKTKLASTPGISYADKESFYKLVNDADNLIEIQAIRLGQDLQRFDSAGLNMGEKLVDVQKVTGSNPVVRLIDEATVVNNGEFAETVFKAREQYAETINNVFEPYRTALNLPTTPKVGTPINLVETLGRNIGIPRNALKAIQDLGTKYGDTIEETLRNIDLESMKVQNELGITTAQLNTLTDMMKTLMLKKGDALKEIRPIAKTLDIAYLPNVVNIKGMGEISGRLQANDINTMADFATKSNDELITIAAKEGISEPMLISTKYQINKKINWDATPGLESELTEKITGIPKMEVFTEDVSTDLFKRWDLDWEQAEGIKLDTETGKWSIKDTKGMTDAQFNNFVDGISQTTLRDMDINDLPSLSADKVEDATRRKMLSIAREQAKEGSVPFEFMTT